MFIAHDDLLFSFIFNVTTPVDKLCISSEKFHHTQCTTTGKSHFTIVIFSNEANFSKDGITLWSKLLMHCISKPPCEINNFCVLTTRESKAIFGASKMHLSPRLLGLLAVLRLWFCCICFIVLCTSHWLWGFSGGLCFGILYVLSSFAIFLTRKSKLVALLLMSFWCLVTVNVL